MEEEVNGKVGDVGGTGGRAEVEEAKIKGRMLEKGVGEGVSRRKKMAETLKDSDGMNGVGGDVKGIDRWGGGGVEKRHKRSEEVKGQGGRAMKVSDEEGDN